MLLNSDFKELLRLFEEHRVRYLIVGGYAVMKYSEPRFTKDIDFWIAVDPENARAIFASSMKLIRYFHHSEPSFRKMIGM